MVSKTPATVYLVGIDSTPCAAHALEVACTLGASLGGKAELHIVHVLGAMTAASMGMGPFIPPSDMVDGGRSVLDTACLAAAGRFAGSITGHLRAGDSWREIVQLGSNLRADLIVVGTAGRTGVARMVLGSVSEKVVRHAGCPVLVVRPKDHHIEVEPRIEPPCGDCVKVQNETARAQLWCARHAEHHPHGHLHYEVPATFAVGSMNFRP